MIKVFRENKAILRWNKERLRDLIHNISIDKVKDEIL